MIAVTFSLLILAPFNISIESRGLSSILGPLTVEEVSPDGTQRLSATLNATTISSGEEVGIMLSVTNISNQTQLVSTGRDVAKYSLSVYTAGAELFSAISLPNCTLSSFQEKPYFLLPNHTIRIGDIGWPTVDWCYSGARVRGDMSSVIAGSYVMMVSYNFTLRPIIVTLLESSSGILSYSNITLILAGAGIVLTLVNIVYTLLIRTRVNRIQRTLNHDSQGRKASDSRK